MKTKMTILSLLLISSTGLAQKSNNDTVEVNNILSLDQSAEESIDLLYSRSVSQKDAALKDFMTISDLLLEKKSKGINLTEVEADVFMKKYHQTVNAIVTWEVTLVEASKRSTNVKTRGILKGQALEIELGKRTAPMTVVQSTLSQIIFDK
jgi:hypothetical protein